MPAQSQIIPKVNQRLEKEGFAFKLNESGVCSGLVALFIKYRLENKVDEFLQNYEKLAALTEDYQFGSDSNLDRFIQNIELFYAPHKYNQEHSQSFLEQFIVIDTQPITNEFNLGLITTEQHWQAIFRDIAQNGRCYYVGSGTHAIALYYNGRQFEVFDSNYRNQTIKQFATIEQLVSGLKSCFGYETELLGLSVRCFSHPMEKTVAEYPEKAAIIQRCLSSDQQCQLQITEDTRDKQLVTNQLNYAIFANDQEVMEALITKVPLTEQNMVEAILYKRNQFIYKYIQQTNDENTLKTLISCVVCAGDLALLRVLISHYEKKYVLDENIAYEFLFAAASGKHAEIIEWLADYLNKHQIVLSAEKNKFLLLQASYNGCRIVLDACVQRFGPLTQSDIVDYLKVAARNNHKSCITYLVGLLENDTVNSADLFDEEIIKTISPDNFDLLLHRGFPLKPELLVAALARKDGAIFQIALEHLPQENNPLQAVSHGQSNGIAVNASYYGIKISDVLYKYGHFAVLQQCWSDMSEEDKSLLFDKVLADNNQAFLCFFADNEATLVRNKLNALLVKTQDKSANLRLLMQHFDNLAPACKTKSLHGFWHFASESLCRYRKKLLKAAIKNECFALSDWLTAVETISNKAVLELAELALNQEKPQIIHYLHSLYPHCFKTDDFIAILEEGEHYELLAKTLESMDCSGLSNVAYVLKSAVRRHDLSVAHALKPFVNQAYRYEGSALHQAIKEQNVQGVLLLLELGASIHYPGVVEDLYWLALHADNIILLKHLHARKVFTRHPGIIGDADIFLANSFKRLKPAALHYLRDKVDVFSKCAEKELFRYACEGRNFDVANALLARPLQLTLAEEKLFIIALFRHEQSVETLYDRLYTGGYNRLYLLFLKHHSEQNMTKRPSSILDVIVDPGMQKESRLNLRNALIQKAIQCQDIEKVIALLHQVESPPLIEKQVIDALVNHTDSPEKFAVLLHYFSHEQIVRSALKEKSWLNLAFLLIEMTELDSALKETVKQHHEAIFAALIAQDRDCRTILNRLMVQQNASVLKEILQDHLPAIPALLIEMQASMREDHQSFQGTEYAYDLFDNELLAVLETRAAEENYQFEQESEAYKHALCKIRYELYSTLNLEQLVEEEEQVLTQKMHESFNRHLVPLIVPPAQPATQPETDVVVVELIAEDIQKTWNTSALDQYISTRKTKPYRYHWVPFGQFTQSDKIAAASQLLTSIDSAESIAAEHLAALNNAGLRVAVSQFITDNQELLTQRYQQPVAGVEHLVHLINHQQPVDKLRLLLQQYQEKRAAIQSETYFPWFFFSQCTRQQKLAACVFMHDVLSGKNISANEKEIHISALTQGTLGKQLEIFIQENKQTLGKHFKCQQAINSVNDLIDAAIAQQCISPIAGNRSLCR